MARVLPGSFAPCRIKMQSDLMRQLWYHSEDSFQEACIFDLWLPLSAQLLRGFHIYCDEILVSNNPVRNGYY